MPMASQTNIQANTRIPHAMGMKYVFNFLNSAVFTQGCAVMAVRLAFSFSLLAYDFKARREPERSHVQLHRVTLWLAALASKLERENQPGMQLSLHCTCFKHREVL